MKRVLGIIATLSIILFALAACPAANGGGGPSSSTYTLSGSVASPNGVTVNNGTYVYLKLVTNGGGSTAAALYWTRSAFSGGSANYGISGIAAGTYTGWVFIDMDGSSPNNSSAMPNTGDWGIPTGQQITISGRMWERAAGCRRRRAGGHFGSPKGTRWRSEITTLRHNRILPCLRADCSDDCSANSSFSWGWQIPLPATDLQ